MSNIRTTPSPVWNFTLLDLKDLHSKLCLIKTHSTFIFIFIISYKYLIHYHYKMYYFIENVCNFHVPHKHKYLMLKYNTLIDRLIKNYEENVFSIITRNPRFKLSTLSMQPRIGYAYATSREMRLL